MFVDEDAIIDLQPSVFCQVQVWVDTNSSHDSIRLDSAPALGSNNEALPHFFNAGNRIIGNDFHPFFMVTLIEIRGQLLGENQSADSLFQENHCHLRADHSQRRSDFRTDKATTDHDKMFLLICQFAQVPVVLKIAEVNNVPVTKRQANRGTAGSDQQFLVRVFIPLVVLHSFVFRVKLGCFAPQNQFGPFPRIAPNLFNRSSLPQSLRQIGTHVRRVGFHTN